MSIESGSAGGSAGASGARALSFLGTGWGFPPRFTAGGAEVEMVQGERDIRQSLQILLGTAVGERIMQEGYGCDLGSLLFEEVDQALVNGVTNLISSAVVYYEPRIRLQRVEVSRSRADSGVLLIELDYMVRADNSRFNFVFPFYLNEAVAPGA